MKRNADIGLLTKPLKKDLFMEDPLPEKRFPYHLDLVFRRGLGRTLLLSLFGLAIIPMVIVGAMGYHTATHRLGQEIRNNIRITAELKSRQLQLFFDGQLAIADSQGSEPEAVSLFSRVHQMLKTPVEPEAGSMLYLVNTDLTFLAGTIDAPNFGDRSTVDTDQTRLWQKNRMDGNSKLPPPPYTYKGPNGNQVIGTHAEIRFGETPYALIVEIEKKSAFGALNRLRTMIVAFVMLMGVGVLVASTILARTIVNPVRDLSKNALMVANDRFDHDVRVTAGNEIGELAGAFGSMFDHFKAIKTENEILSRLIFGLDSLRQLTGGNQEIEELCLNSIEFLSQFLGLDQVDFFLANDDGGLKCFSRFPGHANGEGEHIISPGTGRVGRAASEKEIIAFRMNPASGLETPVPAADLANLIVVPLVFIQTVKGVLDLKKTDGFTLFDTRFMEMASTVIAVALNDALTRQQEEVWLKQIQDRDKHLKVRETTLEASVRKVQEQQRTFQESGEKLHLKQLELQAANAQMVKNAADLEAHMAILEEQKTDMGTQNTELEKTHRKLEEKARQLEVSSRYKTEFMANMSHELRTPLNSILLLSRLLLENKENTLTSKQHEFAWTIHYAGEDLLNLINDILDLAKVESGKMEIKSSPVRVQAITNAMHTIFEPLAEQNGVLFTCHVDPDVPERLITDRKRIEQIIKNFLSNAFKFTTGGTIRLEISVSRDRALCRDAGDLHDNGCLSISVIDTGIGIPKDMHQMVFEAFQQVDGSTRRKYGGTGLGLSISRELAQLLGGEITLESAKEKGSQFTLYLPIIPFSEEDQTVIRTDSRQINPPQKLTLASPSDETDASKGTEPVPDDRNRLSPEALDDIHRDRLKAMDRRQSVFNNRKVLLVDDDMRTVFAVSNVLEDQGAEVLTGKTGNESLDKLKGFPNIDLILMDVMIAGVDGYQTLREIRSQDRYRNIPIIVLTAKAMKGDRSKCIAAGADDYLSKPVNLDKLTSILKIWLDPNVA